MSESSHIRKVSSFATSTLQRVTDEIYHDKSDLKPKQVTCRVKGKLAIEFLHEHCTCKSTLIMKLEIILSGKVYFISLLTIGRIVSLIAFKTC